jgi:hypothetical protein
MSSPSTVFENEKVELIKNKVEAAKNIKELKLHSDKWIYNNIFNMTDDEADEEEQNIILDLKKLFRHSQIEEEGNDPMVTKNILKKSESEFGEEGSTETGVSGEEPISSQKGKNDFESSIDKSISKKEEGEKEKSEDEETKKEEIEKKSKNDKERKPPETVHVKKKISKKPKTYFVKRKPVTSPMNTAERKIKDDYQYPLLHRFRGGSPLSTERYNKKKRKLIETAFDLSDEVKFDSLKGTFMDEDILF